MQGDFHHWVDLFNHFNAFFEKYIKTRKDLCVEDSFLESDPPFPREAVLQILRVIRIILENCANKHLYSSYEVLFLCKLCTHVAFPHAYFVILLFPVIFWCFLMAIKNPPCYTSTTPLLT